MEIPESLELIEQRVDDMMKNQPFDILVQAMLTAFVLSLIDILNEQHTPEQQAESIAGVIDAATSKIVQAKEQND